MYFLTVRRNPEKEKGPGVMALVNEDWGEAVAAWPCITGGEILEAEKYGGITPPIVWRIDKDIRRRNKPVGKGRMEYTIILPHQISDEEMQRYSKRTFWGPDYFMIHPAGRSSGCVAVSAKYWKEAKRKINSALKKNKEEGAPYVLLYVDDDKSLTAEDIREEVELYTLELDTPIV